MLFRSDYPKITAKTLVIGCKYDGLRTPEKAQSVAKALPGSQYLEAETGHFMHLETPQLFVDTVVPFFKG